MDPHGDGALGVVAEVFNPVHQVCGELVTSLQHAQHHNVVVAEVIHDVACQTFRPVNEKISQLPLGLSLVYPGTVTSSGRVGAPLVC